MRNNEPMPIYSQIAYDIASKIAEGKLHEGQRISGRSLTSIEYGVSPETIRRAFHLLAGAGVVDVRQNSGALVISRESAREYVSKCEAKISVHQLRRELHMLFNQRESINSRVFQLFDELLSITERFFSSNPLQNAEVEIPGKSPLIGKSITDSMLWKSSGGVVIAIRRQDALMISPDPDTILQAGDTLVVSGGFDIHERVVSAVSPGETE